VDRVDSGRQTGRSGNVATRLVEDYDPYAQLEETIDARLSVRPASARETVARHEQVAWLPILAVASLVVLGLLAVAAQYGFHRDELYFIVAGRHPALGYDDQGPLTPLLTAMSVAALGLSPEAIRILPALATGLCVILTALIAAELGGGRRAQLIAAGIAGASGLLAAGHLASTTTYDLLAWTAVLWLVAGLLAGRDQRRWLVVGLVAGLALENKFVMLLLGASLVGGAVLARRWDVLRSRWAWAGAVVSLLVWAPNLAWQVANGLPQLEMARAISGRSGSVVELFVELLLLAGPLLFPLAIAGGWWLLRNPAARPWRTIGWATPILLVLVVFAGGKSYYAAGILPALMAAGAVALDGWLQDRSRPRLVASGLGFLGAGSLVLMVLLVLPVLPRAAFAASPINDIYGETGEQLGWPELVETVERAVADLPADQRERTVILTANYGQAAALELLGSGLPPVYSGHNAYARWGPPAADRTAVIVVSHVGAAALASAWGLGQCTLVTTFDNGLDLANDEQGVGIWSCPGIATPWQESWSRIRHLD